jgi:hypothetical protein
VIDRGRTTDDRRRSVGRITPRPPSFGRELSGRQLNERKPSAERKDRGRRPRESAKGSRRNRNITGSGGLIHVDKALESRPHPFFDLKDMYDVLKV